MCVPEIRRLFLFTYEYVCGLSIDIVVLFSRNDLKLGLWMLSFRCLLTFCDSTHWPLVIDVCTRIQLSSNKQRLYTSITNGQYVLSRKVNKRLNDNIHRPNFRSLRENKTTASMKNPQTYLNRNSLLIFGTDTPHSLIVTSSNVNILSIITCKLH